MPNFDLDLFIALNEEYADKRLVPKPRSLSLTGLADAARGRLRGVEAAGVSLRGKRVLEIGCGAGALSQVLAEEYGCRVVGLDIVEKPEWEQVRGPEVDLQVRDISMEDSSDLGQFDVVLSFVVLEHVVHPFSMLTAVERLLRPGGKAYLTANLHRGPKASHRYREVFFPWPHLLFTDDVVTQFYEKVHNRPDIRNSWVNKLTHAHYETYLSKIGFARYKTFLSKPLFDEQFYERFSGELSRYPKYDLAHDFIYMVLGPRSDIGRSTDPTLQMQALLDRNRALEGELAELRLDSMRLRAMENSRIWKATGPLRDAVKAVRRARRS